MTHLFGQSVINVPWCGLSRVDNALDTSLWQCCNAAIFGSVATRPSVETKVLSTRVTHVGPALITQPWWGIPALTAFQKNEVLTRPPTYIHCMKKYQKMNKDEKRTESQDKRIIQRQAVVGNRPEHMSVSGGNKAWKFNIQSRIVDALYGPYPLSHRMSSWTTGYQQQWNEFRSNVGGPALVP